MRSASLVPKGEKREREKKERSVFEGEREEKTRKRSSSSIEKRVRLRRDVYIERTRNKFVLASF